MLEGYHGPGFDNFYNRKRIGAKTADGSAFDCWVYFYCRRQYAVSSGILIPGGDWKKFHRERAFNAYRYDAKIGGADKAGFSGKSVTS